VHRGNASVGGRRCRGAVSHRIDEDPCWKNINLKRKLSREDYKLALPSIQQRLYDLEKACWGHRVATVIVFEGWDASGKGTAIAALTQRLDPRGFKLHPIAAPRTYEQQRPWLWRFWLKVPDRGEMVIFDRSWYLRVLDERVEGAIPEKAWRDAYRDIVEFERTLADDGVAIVKFFLHISRKEQKERFRAIEADPLEAWRVTTADWARYKKYDQYLAATEEMLELTNPNSRRGTIVEATSKMVRAQKRSSKPSSPSWRSAWAPTRRRAWKSPPRWPRTRICARPWSRSGERGPNAGNTRSDPKARPRGLRPRGDRAPDQLRE